MPLDSQTDYVVWRASTGPLVRIRRRAMEGIDHEVMEAMAAVPRRGAETGGILLGRQHGSDIAIEDFEPVPSEHRFGPSYRLSVADQHFLHETVQWFRSGKQPGLSVVGFYRTHTRPDFALTEEDQELAATHFAEPGNLFLLIKPSRTQGTVADFFLWRGTAMAEAAGPLPFPFRDTDNAKETTDVPPVPEPEIAGAAPPPPVEPEPLFAALAEPDPVIEPETPALPEPPAPPKMLEWPDLPPHRGYRAMVEPEPAPQPEPKSNRQWIWTAVAVVLAAIGGALGYLSVRPDPAAAPARQAATADRGSVPDVLPAPINPKPSPVGESGRPAAEPPAQAVQEPTDIHAFLNHWADAVRRGDAPAAAACYTSRVGPYFTRGSISRDSVRQSIRQSISRYGKLSINRISDVSIQMAGRSKAVVTFRKHWQSAGYDKFSGEEQERVTLVRSSKGAWRISSEQEEKVYWTHRPPRRPR